jgi:hypothetical protein
MIQFGNRLIRKSWATQRGFALKMTVDVGERVEFG